MDSTPPRRRRWRAPVVALLVLLGLCAVLLSLRYREWRLEDCAVRTETLGDVTYRIACTPDSPCGEDVPPTRVPPGMFFVLGDRRDHSVDSRYYGPVPEADLLGRVRWVYFSIGPGGVRWERIGERVR